jgi:hypothetical protein
MEMVPCTLMFACSNVFLCMFLELQLYGLKKTYISLFVEDIRNHFYMAGALIVVCSFYAHVPYNMNGPPLVGNVSWALLCWYGDQKYLLFNCPHILPSFFLGL